MKNEAFAPTPELLAKMDAWWRAANYLSACQLYLLDDPLLRRRLTERDIKKKIVGHWGTVPGQNFIYTHLNRVINEYDLDMIYLSGPGHGGNAEHLAAGVPGGLHIAVLSLGLHVDGALPEGALEAAAVFHPIHLTDTEVHPLAQRCARLPERIILDPVQLELQIVHFILQIRYTACQICALIMLLLIRLFIILFRKNRTVLWYKRFFLLLILVLIHTTCLFSIPFQGTITIVSAVH